MEAKAAAKQEELKKKAAEAKEALKNVKAVSE